jgi:endonuclease III-like uncharacterized protein
MNLSKEELKELVSYEELKEYRGIGDKTAREILAYLFDDYKPPEIKQKSKTLRIFG